MIHLLEKIPKNVNIAVSGGVDSMALLKFCMNGKREINVLNVDHGTPYGAEAREFVESFCHKHDIPFEVRAIVAQQDPECSKEEFWRNERIRFFQGYKPILTAHHLDDVIEWWIYSSAHGEPKLIPSKRDNIIRPFLITPKIDLINYCIDNKVPWMEDKSNLDLSYRRNFVRHKLVPLYKELNGIEKVMIKKLKKTTEDREKNTISTGIPLLDSIFGGGIPVGDITSFYGKCRSPFDNLEP